jgi:hypothetical protein
MQMHSMQLISSCPAAAAAAARCCCCCCCCLSALLAGVYLLYGLLASAEHCAKSDSLLLRPLLHLLLPLLHISAFARVYLLYGSLASAEHSNKSEPDYLAKQRYIIPMS